MRNLFLVAPFWDDVDLGISGNIFYEVHTNFTGNEDSIDLMSQVDSYIQGETGSDFHGRWMIVVLWERVHPWPHGIQDIVNPYYLFIHPDYVLVREEDSRPNFYTQNILKPPN